jgi:polysaccharide export outer membrane protein
MRLVRPVILFAALLLGACVKAPLPVASNPSFNITQLPSLPEPEGGDVVRSTRLSFIGPFSELRVEVFGVPDMQRDIMTDGEGNFSFPLVGTVAAAGKTPSAIAEDITQKLRGRYVRDPQVTVNFKSSVNPLALQSLSVAVDGQVQKPGSYPVVGRVTLMRAVALAGGLTEYAKLDDVLVFREVGGQKFVGVYNLGAIRRGNYADPEIFPNDVVVVGDSPQRRMFKDILQASPLLTTPLIILGNNL